MKIPKKAKCVFKGIIFEVWQWEQEMFDGTFETFEMLRRPHTTQVIATSGENILIAKEEQPAKPEFFSFFGGRIEEDETPLLGAKREFLEEAGFASDDWSLWKTYTPSHKIDWGVHYFIARNAKKIAEPKFDAGEKIEMISMRFDEYIEMIFEKNSYKNQFGNEFVCDLLKMKFNGTLEGFRKKLFLKT